MALLAQAEFRTFLNDALVESVRLLLGARELAIGGLRPLQLGEALAQTRVLTRVIAEAREPVARGDEAGNGPPARMLLRR